MKARTRRIIFWIALGILFLAIGTFLQVDAGVYGAADVGDILLLVFLFVGVVRYLGWHG